jgi:hypothetical protein
MYSLVTVMLMAGGGGRDEVPAAAVEDRKRLTDAIKKASRVGEKGRLSVADFDAVVSLGWGREPAHLYILPRDLEDALKRHDDANPNDKLGGPPLHFHAADKNLMLCVRGMHEASQKILFGHLSGLVGKKVEAGNAGRVLVEHLKGLRTARERKEFVAKLVAAQQCIRAAAKESRLCLVSDETDCEAVFKRVNAIGADLGGVVERVAAAEKEFQAAFENCLKAKETPPKKE